MQKYWAMYKELLPLLLAEKELHAQVLSTAIDHQLGDGGHSDMVFRLPPLSCQSPQQLTTSWVSSKEAILTVLHSATFELWVTTAIDHQLGPLMNFISSWSLHCRPCTPIHPSTFLRQSDLNGNASPVFEINVHIMLHWLCISCPVQKAMLAWLRCGL